MALLFSKIETKEWDLALTSCHLSIGLSPAKTVCTAETNKQHDGWDVF